MAKKGESYQKKEGMTKKDIYDKLSVLKTDKGKIDYLERIRNKSPWDETRIKDDSLKKDVYITLGKLYEKTGDLRNAAEIYGTYGIGIRDEEKVKKLLIEAGDKAIEEDDLIYALKAYKKSGLSEEKATVRVADKRLELANKESDITKRAYCLYSAAEYYERGNKKAKAKKLWIKGGDEAVERNDVYEAVFLYEKANLTPEEVLKKIGERFEKLTKKRKKK